MPRENGLVLDGGQAPSNSFVVWDKKIVYMSVTKAACSSLRWMIADLAGEDPQDFFDDVDGPHPSRLMTIHNRKAFKHTPKLSDLSPEELSQVTPDDGWFIFAVVRDPWSRLWSAWQSKFLTRHYVFVRNYGMEPWFPRIPEKAEDVVEDFRRFVEAHPWTDHPKLSLDSHFWPVARSVRLHGLDYTRVYDLSEMSELIGDLKAHLAAQGHGTELYLPRANETPLHLTRDVLADGVAERIAEHYAIDIETFGRHWDVDKLKYGDPWTADAIRAVEHQARVYERISDFRRQYLHVRKDLRKKRAELRETKAELRRLSNSPRVDDVPTAQLARTVVRRAARAGRRRASRLTGR